MDSASWAVFLVSAFVLLIVPGPAVVYIVTRGVDQGRRAGLVSVLGITVGTLFHMTAAALGISTVLATSATAFAALKYVGAAYLVALGIQKLRAPDGERIGPVRSRTRLIHVFRDGVFVNLLNPKTALFFFAFLPHSSTRAAVTFRCRSCTSASRSWFSGWSPTGRTRSYPERWANGCSAVGPSCARAVT